MLKGQSALALDEALEAAVLRALREAPGGPQGLSAIHGQGPVAQFEDAFRSLLGVPFVLAVSSGTAALHTALMACGVGPEDEVILSTYDWPAGTNMPGRSSPTSTPTPTPSTRPRPPGA